MVMVIVLVTATLVKDTDNDIEAILNVPYLKDCKDTISR